MNPKIALLLCIIGVILLLKLTLKRSESLISATWIPTLLMLYSGSRPIAMWFVDFSGSIGGDVTEGSLLDQIFLSSLFLLAFIVLAKRHISWSNVLKDNRWLFVLIFYIGISLLWSDYAMVTFRRWVRVVCLILCAMVIMSKPKPWSTLGTVIRRSVYVLVPFSILLIKYFPSYGIEYGRWSGGRMPLGVCMQKNGLGLLCTVSGFFLLWDLVIKRKPEPISFYKGHTIADIVILIMTVYLLKGADTNVYSATAIGVLIIGIFIMFSLINLRSRPELVNSFVAVGAVAGVILLIAIKFMGWSPVEVWANFLGREGNLTGRPDIWTEAFKIAPVWSVFGTGFGAFWGLPYTMEAIGQTTGHNGYLEIYIELGLVGIILLAIFLLWLYGQLTTAVKINFDWGLLGICFYFMSVVYNYSESNFLNTNSILWTTLIFLTFALPNGINHQPTDQADSL